MFCEVSEIHTEEPCRPYLLLPLPMRSELQSSIISILLPLFGERKLSCVNYIYEIGPRTEPCITDVSNLFIGLSRRLL